MRTKRDIEIHFTLGAVILAVSGYWLLHSFVANAPEHVCECPDERVPFATVEDMSALVQELEACKRGD